MIEATEVTKVFGSGSRAFRALDSVSLSIEKNEFFTLLGPSGCGKTTLLRAIAGFEQPTSGSITLDGINLLELPPHRRPVNTVFQSYALFPHMTVAENVGFGLKMLNTPAAEMRRAVADMLDLVRMTEMAGRKVNEISGGQQQRVALARALAPRPKVLLLDEPLSALDLKLRKQMQRELKRLQAETGIVFIFVTHDQEEALTMSDRIAVMNAGTIRQLAAPRTLYESPAERFVAEFIGDINLLDANIVARDAAGLRVRFRSGKELRLDQPQATVAGGQVTVAVRPEHAQIVREGEGLLNGVVSDVVYFGTDTNFQISLDEGASFIVREQNGARPAQGLTVGCRIGVTFAPEAAQVLRD